MGSVKHCPSGLVGCIKCHNIPKEGALQPAVITSLHKTTDPPFVVSLNTISELGILGTQFLKHFHCFSGIILRLFTADFTTQISQRSFCERYIFHPAKKSANDALNLCQVHIVLPQLLGNVPAVLIYMLV